MSKIYSVLSASIKHLVGTASLDGTITHAISASYADNAGSTLSGTDNFVPQWSNNTLTATSSIYVQGDEHVLINRTTFPNPAAPETLLVEQKTAGDSINIAGFYGDVDDYLQINLKNFNVGTAASGDVVVTSNDGDENNNYIDLGINSVNYADPTFSAVKGHDGYLIMNGGDLVLITYNGGQKIKFATGGALEENIQAYIDSTGLHASGSVHSASLAEYSNNATSASHALNADYSLFAAAAGGADTANTATSAAYATNANSAAYATNANYADSAGSATNATNAATAAYADTINYSFTAIPTLAIPSGKEFIVDGGNYTVAPLYQVTIGTISDTSVGFIKGNATFIELADKITFNRDVQAIGITGSLKGNADTATSASWSPIQNVNYAGITSIVLINNNNDGTITISTGSVNLYDNSIGNGIINSYNLESKTFDLITGSTNYIVAEHSASLASYTLTTNPSYANGINITRVATLDINYKGPSNWDIHEFDIGIQGLALANKLNNKDIRLYGYQRESGLTLYTTGSIGNFGISEGNVWYGPNSHVIPAFDTTLNGYYTYLFHTVSGSTNWNQTSQSVYDNTHFDSGSGLVALTPGYWAVNYVYRLMGTEDEAAIVLSSTQFSTSLEATNNATTPSNLPSTIRDIGLLIGRFIVQSGSFNPTIESAFSNTFVPAVVTNHEALLGLQGGQGGEHYHLTSADYIGSGTGLLLRSNQPVFGGATQYHVPYWKDGKLTLTGSLQVAQEQYVLINSASFGDLSNPEALLVKQNNTASVNLLGGYGNTNNYLQMNIHNQSTGKSASCDYVATADIGSETANYIDMGIANSGYQDSRWPAVKPLEGYLYVDGGGLLIGTNSQSAIIRFVAGGISDENQKAFIDSSGLHATGSLIGTASYANHALSASYAPTSQVDNTYAISASWVSASVKITNADTASYYNQLWISTGSTYPITSSWAVSASWAPTPTDVDTYAVSASWVSASVKITNADTASYYNQLWLITGSRYPITSSWAISASWAPSGTNGTTLTTGSDYPITSSWADNAISASWAPSTPSVSASYAATASHAMTADINYVSSSLTASFAIPSSSIWYTAGPKFLIPYAGVWMVEAQVQFRRTSTTATTYSARINNHAGQVYSISNMYMPSVNPHDCQMKLGSIINVTAPTPITCSVMTNAGAATVFCTYTGSGTSNTGSGATQMYAINLQ